MTKTEYSKKINLRVERENKLWLAYCANGKQGLRIGKAIAGDSSYILTYHPELKFQKHFQVDDENGEYSIDADTIETAKRMLKNHNSKVRWLKRRELTEK